MSFKPIIIDQGQLKQLPAGQSLNVGWDLPTTGPTTNSVLICTQGGVLTWPTIGANKYFSTDAEGDLVFADRPWAIGASAPAAPTAVNQLLKATGVATAAWTTLACTAITTTDISNWNTAYGWGTHAGLYQPVDGDLTAIAALSATGGWAKRTAANTWEISTPTYTDVGAEVAGAADATMSQHTAIYNHNNYNTAYSWGNHAGLYQPIDADLTAIAALSATGGWAKRTAANTWTISTPTYTDVGADVAGAASSAVSAHTSAYLHVAGPTADNQIWQATGAGTGSWTTAIQGLTSLIVDNLTLDGSTITSSTGATILAGGIIVGANVLVVDAAQIKGSEEVALVNGVTRHTLNQFGYYIAGAQNGTMKIRLPWSGSQSAMSHLRISGFNYTNAYGAEGPWQLIVGGYDNASTWVAQSAGCTGNPPFRKVRVAYDAIGPCILLGKTTTVWAYPSFTTEIFTPDAFGSSDYDKKTAWNVAFATDEGPWSLTSVEECPMYIGPGVEIEDDGATGVNLLVNGLELTSESGNVPHITGGNKDIYVATTGNDTTGTGLAGTPYLTVGRAILDVFKLVPSGDDPAAEYTITIHIATGHYAVGAALLPMYAYGNSLYVTGETQDCNASTATSYSADTALVSGLSYVSVTGTLAAGTTAAIGDYLVVKAATGGTNPHLVEGCHEITAWNSGTRVYTAKVIRRAGVAALPAGTITLTTAYVSKTVLTFASGNGIKVQGAYFGGTWNNITLVGNDSGSGVWCLNGGKIYLGAYFSTSHWENNLYSQNQALIYGDYSTHSYALSALAKTQNGSAINIRYGCPLTGSKTFGINCFIGSTVAAYQMRMSAAGGTTCVECASGAFVDASSSLIKDPHAAAEYGNATIGGGINVTGATLSGGTASTTATYGYVVGP